MEKSILCLFLVACMVAICHAYPSLEAEASSGDLGDSFGAVAQAEHREAADVEGDDSQNLNRQKRQFFGGYGGRRYGGYGGGYGRGFGGGYGRGFGGGYGRGFGGGFRRGGYGFYG